MKKRLAYLAVIVVFATIVSCQKSDLRQHDCDQSDIEEITLEQYQRGAGLNLDVTLDVDNTAADVMGVLEEIFQPTNLYVKIGNYSGGTDTAKRAAVINAIANHLGITTEEVEDMTGLELIDALFPDISNAQVNTLTSGTVEVAGIVDAAGTFFDIYVGQTGTDIFSTPDFVLHFDLI